MSTELNSESQLGEASGAVAGLGEGAWGILSVTPVSAQGRAGMWASGAFLRISDTVIDTTGCHWRFHAPPGSADQA